MQRQNHQAQTEHWKPTNREQYFMILGDGEIKRLQWNETIFDDAVWDFGNCFRSRKDAEQARDGMKGYLANFHRSLEGK